MSARPPRTPRFASLGTSAEFWLALQSDYDLEKAKDELKAKIDREVRPRKRAA